MIITDGTSEMIPQLMELWQICHGDSKEYAEMFFKSRFKYTQPLFALIVNKIASAMYLLPSEKFCA